MEKINEQQIIDFLLGSLAEPERLLIEELMFTDDAFYGRILAIQEELADDYVQGGLAGKQRVRFESYFLKSPRRRARVEFAAALDGVLSGIDISQSKSPARRTARTVSPRFLRVSPGRSGALAACVAVALLLAGGTWLAIENHRMSSRLEQSRIEQSELIARSKASESDSSRRQAELEGEISQLRASGSALQAQIQQKQQDLDRLRQTERASNANAAPIATFVLPAGMVRGANEPEKFVIPDGSGKIRIQLVLEKEEDYSDYIAVIRTARGNMVCSLNTARAAQTTHGQEVMLDISTKLLKLGEYEIELKGRAGSGKPEVVGYYYFIALKRQ